MWADEGRVQILPVVYDESGTSYGNSIKFDEGVTLIRNDGKFGFVSEQGQVVCRLQFDEINANEYSGQPTFCEATMRARNGSFYGLVDVQGNELIPFENEDVGCLNEGVVAVKVKGFWQYRDRNNRVAVPGQFDKAGKFINGRAEVLKEKNWCVIDNRGVCMANAPVSRQGRLSSPNLLQVMCRQAAINKIDVLLRNLDKNAIIIDKLSIKVIEEAKVFST